MDPILTYPVVLNASINATLSPAPTNLIKDWLPSIISIVVVIIGGFLTYFLTIRIEEHKRQYELRKEVYFDVMSAIIDFRREYEEYDLARKNREMIADLARKSPLLGMHMLDKTQIERLKKISASLKLLQMKMKICTGEDMNRIFSDVILKAQNVEDYQAFNDAVFNQLIPAIEYDLIISQKHWWQFWK